MAKDRPADELSESEKWRQLFRNHPDLCAERDNTQIKELFTQEYPGTEINAGVMGNIKSEVRAEMGIRPKKSGKKKPGRPPKVRSESNGSTPAVSRAVRGPRASETLTSLENMIDEVLIFARSHDPRKLEDVIRHLKRARNLVIHMNGGTAE